jgi:hypothetical protein
MRSAVTHEEIHQIRGHVTDAIEQCGWKRLDPAVQRCLKSLAQVSLFLTISMGLKYSPLLSCI